MEPLSFEYDENNDFFTIEGIKYSGCLFRQLGGIMPVDTTFKLVKREDGMLTIESLIDINPEGVWLSHEPDRATEASPETRQWAIEQAGLLIGEQGTSASNIIWCAEQYINYVMKGEK